METRKIIVFAIMAIFGLNTAVPGYAQTAVPTSPTDEPPAATTTVEEAEAKQAEEQPPKVEDLNPGMGEKDNGLSAPEADPAVPPDPATQIVRDLNQDFKDVIMQDRPPVKPTQPRTPANPGRFGFGDWTKPFRGLEPSSPAPTFEPIEQEYNIRPDMPARLQEILEQLRRLQNNLETLRSDLEYIASVTQDDTQEVA